MEKLRPIRLSRIATTVAVLGIAGGGIALTHEPRVMPTPIVRSGDMPSSNLAGLNEPKPVFTQPESEVRAEIEVFNFLLSKFVDKSVEPNYWTKMRTRLRSEDSAQYFKVENIMFGNNFLPDARYYSYFPQGVELSEANQIRPSLTLGVLDPSERGSDRSTVVVQLQVGRDGTLSGYSEDPTKIGEDYTFFNKEQLADLVADNFNNNKREEGEITTLTRDGVNVASLEYTDRTGLKRKATGLGNGYLELVVTYPPLVTQ